MRNCEKRREVWPSGRMHLVRGGQSCDFVTLLSVWDTISAETDSNEIQNITLSSIFYLQVLVNTNTIRPTEILGIRHSFSKALPPWPKAGAVLRRENAWFIGTLSKHGKNNWSTDRDGPKPTRWTTALTGYRLPATPKPKGKTPLWSKGTSPQRHLPTHYTQTVSTYEITNSNTRQARFSFSRRVPQITNDATLFVLDHSAVLTYRDRQLGYTPRKPTITLRLNENPTNGVSTGCTGLGTNLHFSLRTSLHNRPF